MGVLPLLAEVDRQVPAGAPVGTRWQAEALVSLPHGAHRVTAAARIDAHGRRREQYGCDGVRVDKAVLLRLTCAETECPHAQQVRLQWADFHRRRASPAKPGLPQPQPWMTEVALSVGRQRFMARSARFPCFTACPNGAHPPLTIAKQGYDLFDDSGCLGGGVVDTDAGRRPRLPTVGAAEAFVLARHLEALAVLAAAREASGSPSGPPPDGG